MKASRDEEMAGTRSPHGLLPYLCNMFLVVRYTCMATALCINSQQ